MDRETDNELKRIWRKLEKTDQDSRELIRVSESVKYLAKKVDRFSLAVTGLAMTVVADVITTHLR